MGPIGDPYADGVDELPGGNRRDMPNDRHQVALAARLHLKDGEAVVFIMERHSLDGPDERFSGAGRHRRKVSSGDQSGTKEKQAQTRTRLRPERIVNNY